MAEVSISPEPAADVLPEREPIINDFSIAVASVNGTGTATSNMAIIRALFRMGIPVNGKNLFPSNIQGLPTWFIIRTSGAGYTARRDKSEILISMNETTFYEDLANLDSGDVCFYPDDYKLKPNREDIVYYPMPVKELVKQLQPPRALKDYIANMVYVGILARMIGIELSEIRGALETHFRGAQKPVDLNMSMVEAAAEWAGENLAKQDPYRVEREDQTDDLILIDGNSAAAMGAVYGGMGFTSWYPITPASSLAESLVSVAAQLRIDENGKQTYAIIQAEDELAAIGMAVGAGWAGTRSMTSTSGPGISLMAEFTGLAFFAEIPVVIWDVQRMGPSTGLPTRTSQGDLMFIRFLGHGDTQQVILLPGSTAECFEFGWRAFDIAEQLQAPVFVLSDLDLGMNMWMSERFEYPGEPMNRGKVLSSEDLEKLETFARYKDVDGDGITYRTLPGNEHPNGAWFARGTGHNEQAVYSERPDDWVQNLERIWRKYETAKEFVPGPVINETEGANIGLIAFGSTDPAVEEARDRLGENGIRTDYLRIRAIPFTEEIKQFINQHDSVYVIEMNTDAQMMKLLQLEVPESAAKLQSIRINDGLPLTARWLVEALQEKEQS